MYGMYGEPAYAVASGISENHLNLRMVLMTMYIEYVVLIAVMSAASRWLAYLISINR